MALSVVLVIITANTPSACTELRKDGDKFGEFSYGLTCADIETSENKVNDCMDGHDDEIGLYAREACCVCGGGCIDRKNEDGDPFEDDFGFGCPTETLENAEWECTDTEHNGITGKNACCSCGGGCINTYTDTTTPWKSAEGKSCYDYELEDPDCTNTTMRGLVDTLGVYSLASACCFCGGGNNRSGETTSTTSNTLSTASAASTSSTQPSSTFSAAPPSSSTTQPSSPSSTQPSSTTIAQTPPSPTTTTQQSKAADDNSDEALTIALAVGGSVLALFACMAYSKHKHKYSPLSESPNTGTNVVL